MDEAIHFLPPTSKQYNYYYIFCVSLSLTPDRCFNA